MTRGMTIGHKSNRKSRDHSLSRLFDQRMRTVLRTINSGSRAPTPWAFARAASTASDVETAPGMQGHTR